MLLCAPLQAWALSEASLHKVLTGSQLADILECDGTSPTGTGPVANPTPTIDVTTIAQKYGLQSMVVQQLGAAVVGSYDGDQRPNAPASMLKLIIADAFLSSQPNLSQTVVIGGNDLDAGQGDSYLADGQTTTLQDALTKMLENSSNVGANTLINQMGGPASVNAIAQGLGYNSTTIKSYFNQAATTVDNQTTADDITSAMNNVYTDTKPGYIVAQQALQNEADKFGINAEASKWSGTDGSTTGKPVTGDSAVMDVGAQKYIITSYINQPYTSDSSPSVGKIRDATNEAAAGLLASIQSLNNSASSGSCCPSSGASVSVSGSISPNVGKGMTASAQQKFQQILVAAGQKFNVDPNFVAAFYYLENARTGDSTNNADSASGSPVTGDGNWREPAPPYGSGAPWPPPNGATAAGPFQFITTTWASYGVDGNGDGNKDVNDLTDAAFGAANYLAASGGKAGASDAQLMAAALSYNHSSTYAQGALNTLHYLEGLGTTTVSGSVGGASCSAASSGTGGYQNPLRSIANIGKSRIDQGVDYTGDGAVYALGNGTVKIDTTSSGWPGGTFISYELSDGPAQGKYVYVAENCTPNSSVNVGSTVTTNSILCQMHNSFPYIETGWATDPSQGNLAAANAAYATVPDGTPTAYGMNFNDLMKGLGAPPGYKEYPNVAGALPGGWPTW